MKFRDQVTAGLAQEFQVFKHQSWKVFVIFGLPVLEFGFSGVSMFSEKNSATLIILNNKAFHFDYSLAAIIMISSMSTHRDPKLQNFMKVNGMSKLAYNAKSLFAHYIIALMITFMSALGSFFCLLGPGRNGTFIFIPHTLAAVALVNLCYLIARFVARRFVIYVSAFWFLVIPIFVSYVPVTTNYLAILNPFVALNVDEMNIKTEWFNAFLLMLVVCIVYTVIFALTGWITGEFTDQKQGKRSVKKEKTRDTTRALMDFDDEDLIVNDIESSVINSGVSSAKYEEPISAENINKTIIRVRELGKIYKNTTEPALDDVTLEILEGEVFCLLGYNGAGKTTLLNILCGLIPKTEGSVHYENKLRESDKISRVLGFCSQESIAFTENTVYENFMLMVKIRGVEKEQAHSTIRYLIEQFKLVPLQNMLVSQLRIEERKRLSLALALINNPKIIIMDEPTSGLDPVARRDIWNKIQVLKQFGKTVIFTTQFLDDAEILADRVAILASGGLFAIGSVDYVKKNFGTGYTLVITNSVNPAQLASQASQITEIVTKILPQAELTSDTTLNILKYALSLGDRNKFARLLRELEEVPDIQINLQRSSLEDAFKGLGRNFKIKKRGNDDKSIESSSIEDHFAKSYEAGVVQQTKAMIFRKYYTFTSEKKNWTFLILLTVLGISLKLILDRYPIGPAYFYNAISPARPAVIYQILQLLFLTFFSSREIMLNRMYDKTIVFRIMGLKNFPFYFGNLIFDFIILLPLTVAFGIECFCCEFPKDPFALNFGRTILTPLCTIIFSYSCSFISTTEVMLVLWNLIVGVIGYWTVAPELMSDDNSLNIDPSSMIYGTMVGIGIFPGPLIKNYLHLIALSCLIHFSFLNFREGCMKYFHIYKGKPASFSPPRPDFSNFVTEEKTRLNDENNQDMVKVLKAEKSYPGDITVLSNLSFGVEKGQIFCLLGPNYSGKSMVFDVLNRRTNLDSGKVYIKNKDVSGKACSDVVIGACLQNDAHWATLTVKQNLTVMSLMRGMSSQEAAEAVEQMMHALDLRRHSPKQARHLSAGTQRKLSVAMALIGGPELVLLDTPTTGVDPVGRNQIWNLLKKLVKAKNSTVLISTHYTEDAELVADKLGIVVNGTLATIGAISTLRKSYLVHYIVIDEVEEGSAEMLAETVKGIIPEAEVVSASTQKGMRFKVPSNAMKFCRIVEELDNLSMDKKITDFSINVETLEQTFIAYASHQTKPTLVRDCVHRRNLYGTPIFSEAKIVI